MDIVANEYYDGENVVENFFERVFYRAHALLAQIRTTNNFFQPTPEIIKKHFATKECELCNETFTDNIEDEEDEDDDGEKSYISTDEDDNFENSIEEQAEIFKKMKKVIRTYHHDHMSGKYSMTICSLCNLKIKYKNELLCVCHNGSGFDFHLLVQGLNSNLFSTKDVHVIAKSAERFIQLEVTAKDMYLPYFVDKFRRDEPSTPFQKRPLQRVKLRFIDSFLFLRDSLDTLFQNVKKENSPYLSLIKTWFKQVMPPHISSNEQNLNLLLRKLPFPYAYVSSRQVLHKVPPRPERHYSNNELKNKTNSNSD